MSDFLSSELLQKVLDDDGIEAVRPCNVGDVKAMARELLDLRAERDRLKADLDAALQVMSEHDLGIGGLVARPMKLEAENAVLRAERDRLKAVLDHEHEAIAQALQHYGLEPWHDGRSIHDGLRPWEQHVIMVLAAVIAERDELKAKLTNLLSWCEGCNGTGNVAVKAYGSMRDEFVVSEVVPCKKCRSEGEP